MTRIDVFSSKVLIDTSAWIEAFRSTGDSEVREAVRSATLDDRAVFCDLVLLELWNGAGGQAERQLIDRLERDIECVSTTSRVWDSAREIARRCRLKGVSAPATDLLIVACAREHGLELLHRDKHFDLIVGTLEATA